MSQSSMEEPRHPDYKRLDEIVLHYFAVAPNQPGFDFNDAIRNEVDPASASFTAIGRAVAFLEIESAQEMQQRLPEVVRLSMFWAEGLHAGILFEKGRP